jgi:RNA polymerase sigma-70 factor (ECF subfamily)
MSGFRNADNRQKEDEALVRRMTRGDKLAFAELYDRFSGSVYAVAHRILSDQSTAEEVVRDVFRSVWEKAVLFDSDQGSVFCWLIALTRRRAIDHLRTRGLRHAFPSESVPENHPGEPAASDPNSTDAWVFGVKPSAIENALSALPLEQRRALEVAFFSGLNAHEIAVQWSEPVETVRTRIRRGLLGLRESLTRGHD